MFSPCRATRKGRLLLCFLLLPFLPWTVATAAVDSDPITAVPVQDGWSFNTGNPVISFGDFRPLGSWNDPCVLRGPSGYIMYLTTSMGASGSPPVLPFRAVSEDGLKWRLEPSTPLMATGKAGAFDSTKVETPSVVLFEGVYHMYYTGVGAEDMSGPMSIGHATSSDGVHWRKDAEPILSPTGRMSDWNGIQVAEPGAVVYRDRIYLYFTSVGLRGGNGPPVKRVIGLATSDDGMQFSPPEAVLEQNVLYPPSKGFDGYSTPSATVCEGRIHLYFDVGLWDEQKERKWSQVALHHAVSEDGRNNWIQDGAAIVTRNQAAWTRMEVRSPNVLFEDDRVMLWFAGNALVEDIKDAILTTGKTRLFGIGFGAHPMDSTPRHR